MLRRAALEEAGIFDERFFMYSEDEDLCFRLRQRGWLVCFCGAGTAVHHGAASSQLHKMELVGHFYRGQLLFLSTHRSQRSTFLYAVLMKAVLILRHWLVRDVHRRKTAEEQLRALKEACAARDGKKGSSEL
jgi:GT2 family glycosyltransferase